MQAGSMDYLLLGSNPGDRTVDFDTDKPMVVILPKVRHPNVQSSERRMCNCMDRSDTCKTIFILEAKLLS